MAVGAGFVPFIGIVYSTLFVVVQFGSATFTPRLNLFRDDPTRWHAVLFFTAVPHVVQAPAAATWPHHFAHRPGHGGSPSR